MKAVLIPLLAGVCASSLMSAQDKENATDRAAIEALGKRWQETWNGHDMDGLSMLLAEDVDFVTVGGPKGWLKGRRQLRDDHAAKHKTRFKDSVWTTKEMHIKFLRPDLAVARVLWSTSGDRVPHIKYGERREGIFMWVVEKQAGRWLVIASQNTENMPPLPGQ
jgi:uncharacterized protein (TIGR02246 family)